MKLKLCLMGLLCLYFSANAQDFKPIKPLHVGDSIPDLTINNILNLSSGNLRLSDFKDKLIILDFWATYCGSCIATFPEEVRLQEKYKNSIQFLLVDSKNTRESKQKVSLFFNSYHPAYRKLPSAVEDTILSAYFPHVSVGYYVWIKNNRILAMTDDQDLISGNILSFLKGDSLASAIVEDVPYNDLKPVYLDNNGGNAPGYIYRTALTQYKPGLHISSHIFFNSKRLIGGFQFVNNSLVDLLTASHKELQTAEKNIILFSLRHPERLSSDSVSENWRTENCYTYEASFPPLSHDDAVNLMRNDIERFFRLRVDSVFRETACFIVRSGRTAANSNNSDSAPSEKDEGFFRDFPISSVIHDLNSRSEVPYVDQTSTGATLRLTFQHSDLTNKQLIEMMKHRGFVVERVTRRLKFLVITDQFPLIN